LTAKVVRHSQQCSKCPPFTATQARKLLGRTPFLHLSAGCGTSSPRARDGRPRAAHTQDAGFHTSVAVAAQQSGSKSCVWGVLQERGYREKIRTVEELQQRITEEWERLDQRVIDNAVKQWRKSVAANGGHFEHLL